MKSVAAMLAAAALPLLSPAQKPPLMLIDTRTIPQIVSDVAIEDGLDPRIALSVADAESRFIPYKVNRSSGAAGVMGVLPRNWKILNIVDPLDPQQNIRGGVGYLATLVHRFGASRGVCLYQHRREACP